MYPKVLMSHPNFFDERARWNFWKVVFMLSVLPTVCCSGERLFRVFSRLKTNLRRTMGQDRLSHLALLCIDECVYVNKMILNKLLMSFHQKSLLQVLIPTDF